MKKAIACLFAAVIIFSILSLTSCAVLSELGIGGSSVTISGEYESIGEAPKTVVKFANSGIEVSIGKRSMSGTYSVSDLDDGTQQIKFDFGKSSLPRCAIRTGTYPISFGTQNGIEYMLIFGARYDKVS